jgi:GntR family transcriptional regulator
LIFIDYHSRVPIYEQIKEQIIMLINTGVYEADEKLPSIRTLSNELNINVNTIKRALSELEVAGVTYSLPGKGVFVRANPEANAVIVQNALRDVRQSVRSAKAKGAKKHDIEQVLEEIYDAGEKYD